MARKFRIPLVAAFVSGIMLLGNSPAFADPPGLPPLNPPPPSFYTCNATGNGAICEGTRTFEETPVDTGIVCGSGADAFDIFDQGIVHQHAFRYYDRNGDLTRRVVQEDWENSQWSNPLTGLAVPYTQRGTITDELAIPGDLSSATETNTGENIYRPPHSAPVFMSVGRFVTAPDGTLEFRAGPQNFFDVFIDGHTELLEPLCAALR